ncbi:hypothetical protein I4U23_016096 [Adineta vaga]|nr:hypothetical protein I4U23_016096 [Adineta vaga]
MLLFVILTTLLTTSITYGGSFDDGYLKTVFEMDRRALLNIPKLDDEEFMARMHADRSMLPADIQSRSLVSTTMKINEDEELEGQPETDVVYDKVVSSAPAMVNFIGALMVVASKRDFPLTMPANQTFIEIKYPQSFRTTLTQLSGSMYDALFNAQQNMYGVTLNMEQIPRHVKKAMQLIPVASPKLISLMLPGTISAIEQIANETLQQVEDARAHHASAVQTHFFLISNVVSVIFPVIIPVRIFSCVFLCWGKSRSNAAAEAAAKVKLQRAQEALQRLQKAEKKYDELSQQITEHQDSLIKTLYELTSIDLKVAGPREIQNVLIKALEQTSKLHEEFVKRINMGSGLEASDREFYVLAMTESAELIERDAHYLHMASKMYYDVSNKYMIEQIASVTQFLFLETDEQREQHLTQLRNLTETNSIKIKSLADK